eukprot:TRINITY_DN111471_c0_g1_i1.p1 TRINITY_DN111471_c0_g1~~TRINITY_DN111471_c0_g1_i1.p1  ORF type:complete len:555 (+),score=125.38 TRINITY_DN111471_c0_g1_i1:125-1789(+)
MRRLRFTKVQAIEDACFNSLELKLLVHLHTSTMAKLAAFVVAFAHRCAAAVPQQAPKGIEQTQTVLHITSSASGKPSRMLEHHRHHVAHAFELVDADGSVPSGHAEQETTASKLMRRERSSALRQDPQPDDSDAEGHSSAVLASDSASKKGHGPSAKRQRHVKQDPAETSEEAEDDVDEPDATTSQAVESTAAATVAEGTTEEAAAEASSTVEAAATANASSVGSSCRAPSGIIGADSAVSCLEGVDIESGTHCTPRCSCGKQPVIQLKEEIPPAGCDGPAWGNKLCCLNGDLYPRAAFVCVPDVFSAMDANDDGVVSPSEFERFKEHGTGRTKLDIAEDRAVEIVKDAELESQAAKLKLPKPGAKEPNPVVHFYIILTGIVFAAIACILFRLVRAKLKQLSKEESMALVEGQSLAGQAGSGVEKLMVKGAPGADGFYELQTDAQPNGQPYWKRADAVQYLFSGPGGKWLIGGLDEKSADFKTDTGIISSKGRHEGKKPHEMPAGTWTVLDGKDWKDSPDIVVEVEAPASQEAAAAGQQTAAAAAEPAAASSAA